MISLTVRDISQTIVEKRKKNVVCIGVTTNKFVFWPLHVPFTVPGLSTCTDAYKYMHICIHMNSHMCTHIYHNSKKKRKREFRDKHMGEKICEVRDRG